MRTTVRWILIVLTAGVLGLTLAGHSPKNVVKAAGLKPITVYRFYGGADGLSHVEKIELKDFNEHDAVMLMPGSGSPAVHRTKPDPPGTVFAGPFHPAAHRQYIFNLEGREEVEFSDGEKVTINAGDIELAEDIAPAKGHRNITLGPEDRVAVFVPITDQTVVRGPLPK